MEIREAKEFELLIRNQHQLFWRHFRLCCDALCELWAPVQEWAQRSELLVEILHRIPKFVEFAERIREFDEMTSDPPWRNGQIPPGYLMLIGDIEADTDAEHVALCDQHVRRRVDCLQVAIEKLLEIHAAYRPEKEPVQLSHALATRAFVLGDLISDSILPFENLRTNDVLSGPRPDLLHHIARGNRHLLLAKEVINALEDAVRWHSSLSCSMLNMYSLRDVLEGHGWLNAGETTQLKQPNRLTSNHEAEHSTEDLVTFKEIAQRLKKAGYPIGDKRLSNLYSDDAIRKLWGPHENKRRNAFLFSWQRLRPILSKQFENDLKNPLE